APGSGTPTGTVSFKDGSVTIGTGSLDNAGRATFSTSALAIGGHSISVRYLGDTNFNGSDSAAVTQTVNRDGTTTTVASSLNPSFFGQMVTFTATVAAVAPGSGTPTGSVTFFDGKQIIGTGALSTAGDATFSIATLKVGTHSITARYGGDGRFLPSTSGVL